MSLNNHQCTICGRAFTTSLAKRRHELKCKDNAGGQGHKCDICGAVLANSQSLHNHRHGCQRRRDETFEKNKRKREHHIVDLLQSQQLDQVLQDNGYESPRTKKIKRTKHDGAFPSTDQTAAFSADTDGQSANCRTCGDDHKSDNSSPVMYKCHLCNKTFRSKKLYFKHRQVHYKRREEGFICKLCDKVFNTARELRSHVKSVHSGVDVDEGNKTLQCSECDETFATWIDLYRHRFMHRNGVGLRIPVLSLPWERDPEKFSPPWVSLDDDGNRIVDERFRRVYTENRNTIHAWHDFGRVRGVYNFPVDSLSTDPEQLRPFLEEIYHLEKKAFKVNIAFGVILQNIETSEMRYYTPYYNNTILDLPFRIDSTRDINDLLNEIGDGEMLEKIMLGIGESSKWQAVYITNVSFFVYRTNYRFGGRGPGRGRLQTLPEYIVSKRSIKCLFTHPTRVNGKSVRVPYGDNLCVFRCMSVALHGENRLERRVKGYFAQWVEFNVQQGVHMDPDPQLYSGISLDELASFEECFKIKINVYSLDPDSCTTQLYSSIYDKVLGEMVHDNIAEMNLNLFESHFSLITNMEAYAMKYRCQTCSRAFPRKTSLNRHTPLCNNRVRLKFPGGIYTPKLSIFEEIHRQLGIRVEKELQYFPWYCVWDYECVLEKINQDQPVKNIEMLSDMESGSSIGSEHDQYNSSDSFIDDCNDVPLSCTRLFNREIQNDDVFCHIPAPYLGINSGDENEPDTPSESEMDIDSHSDAHSMQACDYINHSAIDVHSDIETGSGLGVQDHTDQDDGDLGDNDEIFDTSSTLSATAEDQVRYQQKHIRPKVSGRGEKKDPSNTIYTTRHIPVCVGIASNVPGYNEQSKVFISEDSDALVKDMVQYMEEIQNKTHQLALERWKDIHARLKGMLDLDCERSPEISCNSDSELDSETEHDIKDQLNESNSDTVKKTHVHCVSRLLKDLEDYMRKLPCLSFNGASYDIPAIKQFLPKHLGLAADKNKHFVIKKGNSYVAIGNERLIMLDIARYLAPGFGYDNFLRSYGAGQTKGIFPYEFMNSLSKLDHSEFPDYNDFYSSLKDCNLLEVEHEEWVKCGRQGSEPKTGTEHYKYLKGKWETEGWTTMRDYLTYYVSLDTFPFVTAAQNMRDYYFTKLNIDVFKSCFSSAGISRQLLFEHARVNKTYFSSFSEDQADLYHRIKASCCGGPSIIFHRYAKVGEPIRDEPDVKIQNIVSYDSNALYSHAMGHELPVMFPIRRREEDGYKPDTSAFRHVEQYQWLEYMAHELGVPVKHKLNMGCEVSVPPFFVDGYADMPDGRKLCLEVYGCRYHGHNLNVCLFNKNKQTGELIVAPKEEQTFTIKARQRTLERERYLKSKGYHVMSIYECEFQKLKREDPNVESHSRYLFPDFYLKQKADKTLGRKLSKDQILTAVEDGTLKGLLEVDISVPEIWPENKAQDEAPSDYFSEMAPIFSNTSVTFNSYSKIMQQHSLSKQSGDLVESRKLLVGGLSANKIFLASNLLQWYLRKGLKVTRIYEVVEYKFEKCFQGFCDLMSNERRRADDCKDELLAQTSKVIANSAYGSLLMDKTKHTSVKYVHHCHNAHIEVNSPLFIKLSELPGGLYEIEKSKSQITIDMPTQLAFCILQTAKLTVLQWWYDTILHYVNKLDVKLLAMDTDSTMIAMSGLSLEDSIRDQEKLEEFRSATNNSQCYDQDDNGQPFRARPGFFLPRRCCKKHIKWDKRERGLFKIENEGTEFIGLCSKTYYLHRGDNLPDCIKAKGVNKRNLPPDQCVRDMYLDALFGKRSGYVTNVGFRLHQNAIHTYKQRKCGFTYFYVKRLVADNGIDTLPLDVTLCPHKDYNVYVLCPKRDCLSNDYPFQMFKYGLTFKNCTDLYLYECMLFNGGNEKALELYKCKSKAGVMRLLKKLTIKSEWYVARYNMINDIISKKISQLGRKTIIENLKKTCGKLIVQPGHAGNNFLTCGISKALAEISDPLEFPGEDHMSNIWEEKLANKRFME